MGITNEWSLLKQIHKFINSQTSSAPGDLIQGIGDDCAVFSIDNERCGIITTDISIENIHFRQDFSSPEDIGFKAMTANISDIASMAGKPRFAFVSLGLPAITTEDYVKALYSGMIAASSGTGLYIAGGDLSRSESIVINITLYGEALQSQIIYRFGARPGDHIYCTGTLGGSYAGLQLLKEDPSSQNYPGLISRHRRPSHRLAMLDMILGQYRPTSMIDISDGLVSDLRHICESSNTGFQINAEFLPFHPELISFASQSAISPIDCALTSGEEYELLFTSTLDINECIINNNCPAGITKIGFITDRDYILCENGTTKKVDVQGYNHFS